MNPSGVWTEGSQDLIGFRAALVLIMVVHVLLERWSAVCTTCKAYNHGPPGPPGRYGYKGDAGTPGGFHGVFESEHKQLS